MGFRFQRRFKIAPGVRLNFSKSGISTSVGGKGFTLNSRGSATVGIPGTGLSYRENLNKKRSPRRQEADGPSEPFSVMLWLGIGLIILGGLVPFCAWFGIACILLSKNV